MSRTLLGVMGHVDHGKTALVAALTGMDTDRLPEEKRRGISIALGFAYLDVEGRPVDLVDMPGHERFVRTMVSGATGMTAALLVVAANEGIKPQTLEHVQIATLLGVTRLLPVITKSDLVSDEAARTLARAVGGFLARAGAQAQAPVVASVRTGQGLGALADAIADLVRSAEPVEDDGYPYLPIDRAFSLAGHGTIVTGTLRRGALSADMALQTAPSGAAVRVRGLQVHGAAVTRAEPGQRVAVNLRGLEPGEAPPGVALTRPGQLAPSTWLDVSLQAVADAPPLRTGARLELLFAATEAAVRLRLLDRDVLQPGDSALAQLHCAEPVAAPARERFILRAASPAATLAGGAVIDPHSRRRRRHDPAVLAVLASTAQATPQQIITDTVARAGQGGVGLGRLVELCGLAPERVLAVVAQDGAVRAGEAILSRTALQAAQRALLQAIEGEAAAQPNGFSRRRLQGLAPDLPAEVVDLVLRQLLAAGRLREERGALRLAGSAVDEDNRSRRDEALLSRLAELFRDGGLSPADASVLAPTPAARRAVEALVKRRALVRTFDRVQKREVLFHPDAVEEAKRRLAPLLVQPGLLVKDAGQALGISRKYSVPLLEYLDVVGFTRRIGDRRVLGRADQV